MGVSIITTLPDVCNVKCLCYSCGLKDFPNLMSEWWCEGMCCCLFNNCGINEFLTTQICCLGPCELTAPAFKLNTSIPVSQLFLCFIDILCKSLFIICTIGCFSN
jgi:hypothetical protein